MTNKLISLRLDPTLVHRVDQLARRHTVSRTDMIDLLLRDALARREEPLEGLPAQIRKADQIEGHLKDGHVWREVDEA